MPVVSVNLSSADIGAPDREAVQRVLGQVAETEPAAEPDEPADGVESTGTARDFERVADAERFDRTWLVTKSDIPVTATQPFPVPRPWQGIPRLAFVFNFNMVWDSAEEEWIRDEGNGGGLTFLQPTTRNITRTSDSSDIALDADTLHVVTNTTGSGISMNLPAGPPDGTQVAVINMAGSNANIFTIAQGGDEIMGLANITAQPGDSDLLIYDASENQWWSLDGG